MTLGEKIKELRLRAGMTQEELGERVGLQKAAIYKYENGLVVNLKRSTIGNLAQALGVSPSELMGFEENSPAGPRKVVSDDDIKFALFDGEKGITDEQYEEVKQFAKFVRERDEKKGK